VPKKIGTTGLTSNAVEVDGTRTVTVQIVNAMPLLHAHEVESPSSMQNHVDTRTVEPAAAELEGSIGRLKDVQLAGATIGWQPFPPPTPTQQKVGSDI